MDPNSLRNHLIGRSFLSRSPHFTKKGLYISIFIVVLLLFPKKSPEFIRNTFLIKIWELFHLSVVGITVTYGVFSNWNSANGRGSCGWMNGIHACETSNFQVASVLKENEEIPCGFDTCLVQTWNHQCTQEPPMVLIEEEKINFREHMNGVADGGLKPLRLPVRSLKSHVYNNESRDSFHQSNEFSVSNNVGDSNSRDDSRVDDRILKSVGEISVFPSQFSESGVSNCYNSEEDLKDRLDVLQNYLENSEFEFDEMESRPSRPLKSLPPSSPPFNSRNNYDNQSTMPNLDQTSRGFYSEKLNSRNFQVQQMDSNKGNKDFVQSRRKWKDENFAVMEKNDEMPLKSMTHAESKIEKKDKESKTKMIPESEDVEGFLVSENSNVQVICSSGKEEGPENEVDKKADAFIAKFREQMRLQRTNSIER